VHCDSAREIVFQQLHLNKRCSQNVSVIQHGSYVEHYENKISRFESREKLKLRQNDIVFLFFGIIRPYKGIQKLIKVIKKLSEDNRVKLVIAGKPINEDILYEIKKEIGSKKCIQCHLRYVSDCEIQTFMNAADAVVLPYNEFLTSGVALLAMSFGKALIVPKKGCNIDLDPEGTIFRNYIESAEIKINY